MLLSKIDYKGMSSFLETLFYLCICHYASIILLYHNFVTYLEIKTYDATNFTFISQDCFGYLASFVVPHKFFACCGSVAHLCLTLCDSMDCSMPGFPVLHHLPEFDQTLVHYIGDDIQPSHPLSPSSPFALNLSQHQDLSQ